VPAWRARWRRVLAAAACALLGLTVLAHDAPGSLPWSAQARGGRLVATLDLAPAYPATLQRQLSNGLTNVIAIHLSLVPERGGDPVALDARTFDVLYDVWDETFGVTVRDASHPTGRVRTFRRFEELRAFLSAARDVDLGPVGELGDGRWVLVTHVELNPVSKELLERTREFIANPSSGRGAPSRSVLGAMASYLFRTAEPGDVHQFRTAPFTARELGIR
jgi:hypothetical protein